MIHEIPLERRTLHGHFSPDLPPVLTVDDGDTVAFACLDAGWHAVPENQFFADLDPELDCGHALVGPVEIPAARAGGTLEVRIDTVRVGTWGITFAENLLAYGLGRSLQLSDKKTLDAMIAAGYE